MELKNKISLELGMYDEAANKGKGFGAWMEDYIVEKGNDPTPYFGLTNNEVFAKRRELNAKGQPVPMTAYEMLLQQEGITELLQNISWEYDFSIETNGTIEPDEDLVWGISGWVISPKLKTSGEESILDEYFIDSENFDSRIFKFVIGSEQDLLDMEDYIIRNELEQSIIYLMPEGTTIESQTKILKDIIEYAKQNDYCSFIVTPRLHILAYGNKRGA